MHGYELARLICEDEALRAIWRLKRSEVYFLLGKLLAQGYIAEAAGSEQGHSARKRQASGPPRQIYEVTPAGRALLDAWLAEPVSSPRDLRAAFLVKLYLATRRDAAMALALLERQRQVLIQWQARLQLVSMSNPLVSAVHRLRLAQVVAALGALEEIRAMLEAPASPRM